MEFYWYLAFIKYHYIKSFTSNYIMYKICDPSNCEYLYYRLKEFVDNTGQLNILDNYPQLKERSKAIGYEISKVVYRGFQCNDKLQVN